MRSTTLKGEPILHIHSLRYYLYTIYIVLTLIHVYDAWFDIWLMISESPWDEALLLNTSITAVALVSNGSKLGGLWQDWYWVERISFFFFLFSFRFLSLGAEWWELIEGFGPRTSLYLTDICKSPISRGCISWTGDTGWLQHRRSRLGRNVCLYIHGCVGHAWGMWTIDMAPRQGRDYYRSPPLFKSLARKKEAGFDVAAVSFVFSLKLAFVLKQQDWQGYFLYFFSFFFLEKVPAFSTEDAEERRQRKKEIICVDGAGEKKNNPSNNL